MSEEFNVNPATEAAIVDLLSDLFSSVAYIDPDTVADNLVLGCEGGFSLSDRSIRIELGNYLMSHFALIFMGLLVNNDFRNTFMEAVTVEMALMDRDSAFVKKIREDMREEKVHESKGNYVFDFSKYNETIYHKVNEKLLLSFDRLKGYEDVVDTFAADLTDDDIIDIGFVISNFMYLMRAFSKNGLFTDYVKSVIHTVQKQLDID